MHFIHHPYQPGDTIAAIATPPGEGGIAIIRISGARALEVAATVFTGPVYSYKSHTAHYGRIIDSEKRTVDHVLLLVMLGKRSYTGEDTVEIHCHGGSAVVRRVLEVVMAAGARAALPGEFTCKAFMNGKLDLAQAEAVQALIGAKGEQAMDAARLHLEGRLSREIAAIQSHFTDVAAIIEAWVDFPEEGLEFATLGELCSRLEEGAAAMAKLLRTFHEGRILAEGLALCLVGAPNVGKSSLMNALLDKERAIVSSVAGTTRDLIEDNLRLNGLEVRLVDTAGIRTTAEAIEQEGIRRSHAAASAADLVLLVLDASRELHAEERELMNRLPIDTTIVVWNKRDLAAPPLCQLPFRYAVEVSALERQGLDTLKATVDSVIWEKGPPQHDELIITNVRHQEALKEALQAADNVIAALRQELSPELVAVEMRSCLLALGKILGADVSEEVLTAIFSKFCIGK